MQEDFSNFLSDDCREWMQILFSGHHWIWLLSICPDLLPIMNPEQEEEWDSGIPVRIFWDLSI